jgi:predicted alpha/beta superfamily hydrolase
MKKIAVFGIAILATAGMTYIIMHDHFTGRFPWSQSHSESEIHRTLYSAILKEERDIIIHLPLHYDSTIKYPVMYVLDGSSEDKDIANKFDVLSTAGYTPQTIVVGIPNMTAENRQRNLTPPFMRMDADDKDSPAGEGDSFLLFMESELFPFIEENYPASEVRLFSGNSRGGLLVMYSLITKPGMFQARFCYSTPFWRHDNILVTKVADFLHSKDTLNTFLYMSAGTNETDNIKNGLMRMTETLKEKAPAGFSWYSDYTPDAVHQNNARLSHAAGIARWSEYFKAQLSL